MKNELVDDGCWWLSGATLWLSVVEGCQVLMLIVCVDGEEDFRRTPGAHYNDNIDRSINKWMGTGMGDIGRLFLMFGTLYVIVCC